MPYLRQLTAMFNAAILMPTLHKQNIEYEPDYSLKLEHELCYGNTVSEAKSGNLIGHETLY